MPLVLGGAHGWGRGLPPSVRGGVARAGSSAVVVLSCFVVALGSASGVRMRGGVR